MKNLRLFIVGATFIVLGGCVSRFPWQDQWWGKRMATYKDAQAIEIEYLDPKTWNPKATREERHIVVVTEKQELDRINENLPINYMRSSNKIRDEEIDENEPCYFVSYPTSGKLNDDGIAYPATCLFITLDGLVYHGRGGIVNPDYHGLRLPRYLDIIREIYDASYENFSDQN